MPLAPAHLRPPSWVAAPIASASGRAPPLRLAPPAAGLAGRRRSAAPRAARLTPPSALGSDGGDGEGGLLGRFKSYRNRKEREEAAKQVIQDTFKDKGDPLSAYDPRYVEPTTGDGGGDGGEGGGGGGDGSGGGGGGGGHGDDGGGADDGDTPPRPRFDWRAFDWRASLVVGLDRFRSAGKAATAVMILVAGVAAFAAGGQISAVAATVTAWLLRLDGAGPRRLAAIRTEARRAALEADSATYDALGPWEAEALARYGPDPDGTDGANPSLAAWRATKAVVKARSGAIRARADAARRAERETAVAKVGAAVAAEREAAARQAAVEAGARSARAASAGASAAAAASAPAAAKAGSKAGSKVGSKAAAEAARRPVFEEEDDFEEEDEDLVL